MNYLSNKELYKEILISKNIGKLTDEARKMFDLMIGKVLAGFVLEPYLKMECRQTAYLHIYSGWFRFDEESGDNAFAYFTQIIKNAISTAYNVLNERKKNGFDKIDFIYYTDGDWL